MRLEVSQAQIARVSGLSRTAVSFALNEKLRARLNPETCRRVLDTAKRLGYVPHHAARRLARQHSHNKAASFDQVGLISVVNANLAMDSVRLAMMDGAEQELSRLHAALTLVRVRESEDWGKVERLTRAGGLDGWLLYGAVDDPVVDRLKPGKLPFVLLGDHRCTQPIHCVTVDNEAVGRLAVEHLASLGHRRIGFLGSGLKYVYEQQTFAGYRDALQKLGLDEDERLIDNVSLRMDNPVKGLIEWLRSADPMPTAVFATEFEWAAMVLGFLKEAQIEVPKQISILGYETASFVTRENFTRIELPMAEVGRQGALLLHKLTLEPSLETGAVKISPSLIQGWSTCPPISHRK